MAALFSKCIMGAVVITLVAPHMGLAQSVQSRLVMVGGGSAEFDACGAIGEPKGLNPKGDNFLALKAAPNVASKRKAKLGPGKAFIVCEYTKDEKWVGVVVPMGKQTIDDCGLGGAIERRRAYKGPCMQGWVAAQYVKYIAG